MKNFLVLAMIFLIPSFALASADHAHEEASAEHAHEENDTVELSPEQIAQSEIIISTAQAGIVRHGIDVFGKVTLANNSQSHIRARFPGTVKQLFVQLGNTVKQGQKLATIEANQSLQRYTLTAPIAGVINESHANLGEFVSDQRLFSIIDPNDKWAELLLFPSQFATVKKGASVLLKQRQQTVEVAIDHIIIDQQQGVYRARAKLKQTNWPVATPFNATIYTESKPAAVRIHKQALQTIEGKTVVFTKNKNQFIATELSLGLQDKDYAEVLDGLELGQEYVSQGSFLLKADLLKNGAAHQH